MAETSKQNNALLYFSLPIILLGYTVSVFSPENVDKTIWIPAFLNLIALAQNVGVEFFGREFPQWLNGLKNRFDELNLLENTNLRKPIKKAICNIIETEIPQISDEKQQTALKNIIQTDDSAWNLIQILQAEDFEVISLDEISRLFSADIKDFSQLKSPITQNAWKKLLLWLERQNSNKLTDKTLNQVSKRLTEKFSLALKDAFLTDFKEEGKAFAELLLTDVAKIKDFQSEIIGFLQELKEGSDSQNTQILKKIGEVKDLLESQTKTESLVEFNGVEKIDLAFLNAQQNTQHTKVDFYLANYPAQWWGILNNLDEKISIYTKVKKDIEENLYGYCPIVALLHGSGGTGKTTLARQLAVDFVKNENTYDFWWIDCQRFEEAEEGFIKMQLEEVRNPAICIIDDWGKLSPNTQESFKRLFGKIHRERGALKFIITNRRLDQSIDTRFLVSKYKFDKREELKADNDSILQKVFANLGERYKELSEVIFSQAELCVAKPFFLLYVLMRIANNEELLQQLRNTATNAEGYFREIIQYDLNQVYNQLDRKGLVAALGFLAYLQKTHHQNISKDSFLILADFELQQNSNFNLYNSYKDKSIEQWRIIGQYLYAEKSSFARREDSPEFISFNKDDFIEAVLQANIFNGYPDINEYIDEYKTEFAEFLIENGSVYSASYLAYSFCYLEESLSSKAENIVQKLLDKKNTHHAYTKIFLRTEHTFVTNEKKWQWIKEYLSFAMNNSFFERNCVSWLKSIFLNDKSKLLAHLLEINDLGASSSFVVNAILNTLEGKKKKIKAIDLLNSKDPQVICNCLQILKDDILKDKALKAKAVEIFETEGQHPFVICVCLQILKDDILKDEKLKAKAIDLLNSKDKEVVCNCLQILKDDILKDEKLKAKAIELFKNSQDYQVICVCLQILKDEPEGKHFANKVLDNWQNENNGVVIRALETLSGDKKAEMVTNTVIKNHKGKFYLYERIIRFGHGKYSCWEDELNRIIKNWWKQPEIIVGHCLFHFKDNLYLTEFVCRDFLEEWKERIEKVKTKQSQRNLNFNFLIKSLAHPYLNSLAKEKAKEMLDYESSNTGFLPDDVEKAAEDIVYRNVYPEWYGEKEPDSGLEIQDLEDSYITKV